jgi:hypothetical protein
MNGCRRYYKSLRVFQDLEFRRDPYKIPNLGKLSEACNNLLVHGELLDRFVKE